MGARTKARKRALDILFESDQRGANAVSTLDQRILNSGRETPLPPYAIQIVRGVVSRWVEINAIIQDASPAWTVARMPGVDRALLRIATWEMLCNDDVPTSVAIDEAVTLAKGLSTDESAKFINGLLSTIAKDAPALSNSSLSEAAEYDNVESVDGAAIFDSLGAGTYSAAPAGAGDHGAGDEGADDDDEPEADADFADAGLSDALAKEWAERLLADDEAELVPMPAPAADDDAESSADGTDSSADAADSSAVGTDFSLDNTDASAATATEGDAEAAAVPAASADAVESPDAEIADEAPEPTHLQD